jgi:hypothetical protein
MVPAVRIQNHMNAKFKTDYPCKYTRKNKVRPKQTVIGTDDDGNLIYKTAHVDKTSTKLSLAQSNVLTLLKTIVNFNYKKSCFKSKVIKEKYVRTDNYNCKQRRSNNRLILLSTK